MRNTTWVLIVLLAASYYLTPVYTFADSNNFQLVEEFSNLELESVTQVISSENMTFIVEQTGKISAVNTIDGESSMFLDISERVYVDTEGGLLSMALHPAFSINRLFYISYTIDASELRRADSCDPCLKSIVSEWRSLSNKAIFESERILIELNEDTLNHRINQILFGPDDLLFVLSGDSSKGGQKLNDLYGKILRLNTTHSTEGLNYGIPEDNPFIDSNVNIRKEIYAYGLRNPWRGSFHPTHDDFIIGDVGQDNWEELNVIVSGQNYGWNIKEGIFCYNDENCDSSSLIDPSFVYPHSDKGLGDNDPSGIAVIGGQFYFGDDYPNLRGKYIFGDYLGSIWSLDYNEKEKSFSNPQLLVEMKGLLSSIDLSVSGELYFSENAGGSVWKLRLGKEEGILFHNFAIHIIALMTLPILIKSYLLPNNKR